MSPKERPILFSGPMVRAILEGRKSMTRRVVKPQPEPLGYGDNYGLDAKFGGGTKPLHTPYGVPGDRLWVRETWQAVYDCPELPCCEDGGSKHRRVVYRATEPDGISDYACSFQCGHDQPGCARWRPSIHMPRWASRITLEVTGVRVERLQDISEEDAWAEGIEQIDGLQDEVRLCELAKEMGESFEDGRPWFANLWESINGRDSWKSNPWVWVIEFKRLAAKSEAA